MEKYRALILDMDGTIMSSIEPLTLALQDTGDKWGIPITPELLFIVHYQPSTQLEKALALGEGYAAFSRYFFERLKHYAHLMQLFPGIADLLTASVPLGIVTSEDRHELLYNLRRLGLNPDAFAALVCCDDTPYEKPHPYPLQYCVQQMGFAPHQALYVGDSLFDRQCAQAAGVDFGLAGWGVQDAAPFAGVLHHFAAPGDILAVLDLA